MTETQTTEWEGRTIAWRQKGTGPAVVLCHGTPFSSWVWRPYAQALARDHTVFSWDMPGYGASSKHPEHAVDFDAQARAFVHLLETWGLDRPHVVAHDFGGAVTLRATLVLGARYASLLLADVVAIPPSGSPFFRYVEEHAAVLEALPAYIHEAVVRTYVQGAAHRPLEPDTHDALVAPWLGDAGQGAFYRQIAQYDERYLEENERRMGELDVPVRILWGTEDAWIPVTTGERLHGLIPQSTWQLVPGAGHLLQLDAPVAMADELRAWLDRQP